MHFCILKIHNSYERERKKERGKRLLLISTGNNLWCYRFNYISDLNITTDTILCINFSGCHLPAGHFKIQPCSSDKTPTFPYRKTLTHTYTAKQPDTTNLHPVKLQELYKA
jgi:hypothetical protein